MGINALRNVLHAARLADDRPVHGAPPQIDMAHSRNSPFPHYNIASFSLSCASLSRPSAVWYLPSYVHCCHRNAPLMLVCSTGTNDIR